MWLFSHVRRRWEAVACVRDALLLRNGRLLHDPVLALALYGLEPVDASLIWSLLEREPPHLAYSSLTVRVVKELFSYESASRLEVQVVPDDPPRDLALVLPRFEIVRSASQAVRHLLLCA